MLRKTLLTLSTGAMLGAAVIAPNAALAQLPPPPGGPPPGLTGGGPAGLPRPGGPPGLGAAGLPRPPGVGGSRPGLHGGQGNVYGRASSALGHTGTAAPGIMAMAAQAMPTAMDRGETATGRLMASLSTAILTPAAAITPTTTATGWAHTGAFRFAPNSECGGDVTAPRYARRGARRDMKTFWRMHAHQCMPS